MYNDNMKGTQTVSRGHVLCLMTARANDRRQTEQQQPTTTRPSWHYHGLHQVGGHTRHPNPSSCQPYCSPASFTKTIQTSRLPLLLIVRGGLWYLRHDVAPHYRPSLAGSIILDGTRSRPCRKVEFCPLTVVLFLCVSVGTVIYTRFDPVTPDWRDQDRGQECVKPTFFHLSREIKEMLVIPG